ncbi:hypothetical protein CS557_01630 [Acinetobacter junii]|uniref:O-antigen ligase family protein n=1 Tax=Acinetobacter junii TaxID=40215 RepID=UPI000C1B1186|nr:O-antigen ligase family protein [Acinetobacter junii]ATU44260.1 hypothetical protein CS557_01630 [Acinetobacter junii]
MSPNILKKYKQLSLWCVALLSFIAFSSRDLYWVHTPYDAWRIYEIVILCIWTILLFFIKKPKTLHFNKNISNLYFYSLIFLFFISCLAIYHAQYRQRAIVDISLYFLLITSTYLLANLFKKLPITTQQVSACLAILPLLCLLFLPFALYQKIQGNIAVWHQSFPNIRVFDDALLPCLFLLWFRPAWLSYQSKKSKLYNFLITILIYFTSILYLLSFLFHGARSSLLSIGISVFIGIFLYKDWKNFKIPFFSLLTSGTIFYILIYILSINNLGTPYLARSGSSGRIELWEKCILVWKQHPFFGIGGDHFSLVKPFYLVAHPHNIPLQFLAEWGIISIITMLLFMPIIYKIFKNIQQIPSIIFSASIAISINSLLSGSMVYPISQVLNIWIFAYLISYLLFSPLKQTSSHAIHNLLKYIAMIAMIAMIAIHGQDIVCNNCISIDWEGAPRFWDAGRTLHLVPFDIEKIEEIPTRY